MKAIALDLDGVVFDSENLYRVYTEIYDVEKNGKDNIIDNTQRIFQKRYNWTEEEFKEFYNTNVEKILTTANFMTGVAIVLNKLKNHFKFIVVTSRNDFETEIAREKLKTIGFENIKIFNNEHHKIEKLLEKHVYYIIDDDDNICINAADNGICALYFKNNASNKVDKEKVINVNNWGEIYKYLMLNEGEWYEIKKYERIYS